MDTNNFFDKELSWLEFNNRVLEEALDNSIPLLERLKFLAIFSNNLDEFVMVRIAGLVSLAKSGKKVVDRPPHCEPKKLLQKLQKRITELVKMEYECFTNEILKGLKKEGIKFYTAETIPDKYIDGLKKLFLKKYFLIITPMAIDQARPFPFLSGKSINLLINLRNIRSDENLFAVIPVPTTDRFIPIPGVEEQKEFIYIEELITLFADIIFNGYKIIKTCTFRITRDAELSIDEEDAIDLLSEIEDGLKQRIKGAPIRLEIESSANKELVDYLSQKIQFYEGFYIPINGPLNLCSFFEIAGMDGFEHLKRETLPPVPSADLTGKKESIFQLITKKDKLVHHPFHSFDPVVNFIESAANDEKVLAIKITLYRTSGDSPIVRALKKAAENGKQVTALLELKARFDEAQNINWAKQLEKAGCHVVYGLVGLKIHAKIALVVRDESDGIKRYIHLATGNYNDKTAKVYTDIGFFTSDKFIGRDASAIFNILTGFSDPTGWKKLICAPMDLRNFFLERIKIEIKNVENGGKGLIIAKMNSLIDIKIIKALYKASQTGVRIKLIVRGMCCLKPGIKGLSDNISVISIVDRFLEHSRIFYFYNSGNDDMYLSSADWMERNLDRRVEVLFPLEEMDIKGEVRHYLDFVLKDNTKARVLNQDGSYTKKTDGKNFNSQIEYYNYILHQNKTLYKSKKVKFKFIPKMNPEENKTNRL